MEVYLLCFNLSAPTREQEEQISSWLQIINDSVPNLPQSGRGDIASRNNYWKIVLAGLQQDQVKYSDVTIETEGLRSWKMQYPNLPFHDQLFKVSSLSSRESVQQLLTTIESISSQMFAQRTVLIPPSFKTVLQPIKQLFSTDSFILQSAQFNSLYHRLRPEMDLLLFKQALRMFHTTGHIAFLPNGLVCSPTFISKLISKFVDHSTSLSECSQDPVRKFVLYVDSKNRRYKVTAIITSILYSLLQRVLQEITLLSELPVCALQYQPSGLECILPSMVKDEGKTNIFFIWY